MSEKDNIVKMSNEFIDKARYGLTITQRRLILIAIGRIHVRDDDFQPCEIPVSEIMDLTGRTDGLYSRMKTEVFGLDGKGLTIETISQQGRKVSLAMPWFSSVQYKDGSGLVYVLFSPELKPYLLHLQSNFTTYNYDYVLPMRSGYSVRLYELLKRNGALHKRHFDLDEFRSLLGLEDKPSSSQYGYLKSRILTPATKEITRHSDLQVLRLTPERKSRKVVGFTVCFAPKPSVLRETVHHAAAHSLYEDVFGN